jgi:hypothetical protein
VACLRVLDDGRVRHEVRTFSTTTGERSFWLPTTSCATQCPSGIPQHFESREKHKVARRLLRRLADLGYAVEIKPAAA